MVEDDGTQQYYIGDFLRFRMVYGKFVYDQIHEHHLLVNKLKRKKIFLLE